MEEPQLTPRRDCANCRYFEDSQSFNRIAQGLQRQRDGKRLPDDLGLCHRYPVGEIVTEIYWCGEFSPKQP